MPGDGTDTAINVTAIKDQFPALIDAAAQGRASRVVPTQHGQPVAALVPYEQSLPNLCGALRGIVTVSTNTELTRGTVAWQADVCCIAHWGNGRRL